MKITDALLGERNALLEAVSIARHHFAKEERLAFPMAEAGLGRGALETMGVDWAGRRDVYLG